MFSQVVRVLANTVAKGEGFGPRALSVSEGGGKLAFIGPLDSTITVLDAHTLDEVSSLCLLICLEDLPYCQLQTFQNFSV